MVSKISNQNQKQIRILRTKPKIHQEKKVLITIGPDNHDCYTYNNVDLWKYGDIFCYHENIWEARPNLKKIAFLWLDTDEAFENMKKHIGDVYFIIARKQFIEKHKIIEQQKTLKLTGILPIEDLMNMQQLFYNQLKTIMQRNEFSPKYISYSLALSFNKNYIYHFESEHYEKPDHYDLFGETNIYWSNNPEHTPHIREYFAQIYLFQQYYVPTDSNRRREINYCMKKNIHSGFFDKIILMNEKLYDKFDLRELENPVVQQINLRRRMTYQDVINYTNKVLPKHCYIIIANSDIYFNETLFSMFNIELRKTLLALLRFDLLGDLYDKDYQQINIFGPRDDSQDVWIFKKQDGLPNDGGFSLGQKGCDNAITGVFLNSKFRILNPAFNIQTIHVHMTNLRTYDQKKIVYYPYYLMIQPHSILHKQIKSPTDENIVYKTENSVQYEQLYPHYSQEIRTFMNYAEKKHKFAPSFGENVMSKSYAYNKIYKFRNVFCNNVGSIYDKNSIYTLLGDNFKEVHNNNLKTITPVQRAVLISQFGDDTSRETRGLFWFLKNSMPRMLIMSQSNVSSNPFICNINKNLAKYMEMANVFLRYVKADDNIVNFVHELIVPQPLETLNYPREYISLIRKHFNITDDAEDANNIVVLVRDMEFHDEDEEWEKFTTQIKEKLQESHNFELKFVEVEDKPENYTSSVQYFKDALIVVGHRCEIMANCIFTPKHATIYESAFESTPDLELWNLCAAAEHHYSLVPYKREPKSRQQYMVIKKLKMAIETSPWKYHKYEPHIEIITENDVPEHIFVQRNEYPFIIKINEDVNTNEEELQIIQNLRTFISNCEDAGFLTENSIQTINQNPNSSNLITIEYDNDTISGDINLLNPLFKYSDFNNLYECKYTQIEEKQKLFVDISDTTILGLSDYKYIVLCNDDINITHLLACFASGSVPVINSEWVTYLEDIPISLDDGVNYVIYEPSNEDNDITEFIESISENIMTFISKNNKRLYEQELSMVAILSHIKSDFKK
jgi:hypothetical protein